MLRIDSHRLRVRGAGMHCRFAGEGPPLLLVRGFPVDGRMWRCVIAAVAGFRAIVPDLRGFGRSDVVDACSIADHADDLAALLDVVGDGRPAVVCGLSMGGIIAFEFFRRHRRRTRALVLCNTRSNAENAEGAARREAIAQRALEQGARAIADDMIQMVLAPKADPAIQSEVHDLMCATAPCSVAAGSRALGGRADSQPTLGGIDRPTLVVAGAEDRITPPEGLRALCAAIPGARLALLAGAGHLPPLETPAAFGRALTEFLRGLPPL